MKKPTYTLYGGRSRHTKMCMSVLPDENVHVGFFHSYLKETKKHQLSILII